MTARGYPKGRPRDPEKWPAWLAQKEEEAARELEKELERAMPRSVEWSGSLGFAKARCRRCQSNLVEISFATRFDTELSCLACGETWNAGEKKNQPLPLVHTIGRR